MVLEASSHEMFGIPTRQTATTWRWGRRDLRLLGSRELDRGACKRDHLVRVTVGKALTFRP